MNFILQAKMARNAPSVYFIILFLIVLIATLFIAHLLIKFNKKKKLSAKYIKLQQEKTTTRKDVQLTAKKYNFDSEEENVLWKICKKYKIKNILYVVKQLNVIDEYFKRYYTELKETSEIELSVMFRLRFKLERILAGTGILSSTHSIPIKTKIDEIFKDGSKKSYIIVENTKDYLGIQISQNDFYAENKPQELEKVAFTFTMPTQMSYAFVTRVIKYSKNNENHPILLVAHTNKLLQKQQRHYKRININEDCFFSYTKMQKNKNGKTSYNTSGQKYKAQVTNISGGGCCITTQLPIKEEQLIYLELLMKNGTIPAVGKIVKTRKSYQADFFNLHIKFISISVKNRNRLIAYVYNYEE